MKKIVFLIFCLFGIFPMIAQAEEAHLEEEYLKGVYYLFVPKEGEVHIHQQAIFRLNGKIAYCLEPDIGAKAGDYKVTEGLSGSYLSKEMRDVVEEYGYYGYEYPGHQTVNFYLAAQELIWEAVSDYEVKWVTHNQIDSDEINIESEKQEIIRLISEEKKLPSFANQVISLYEGETLLLQDDNHLINRFQFDQESIVIKNDQLQLGNISNDMKITGTLKQYDQEITLLYRQEDSQKMATLRLSHPTSFDLSLIVEGTSIKIHKTGEVWSGIWNTGEWKNQNGIEFDLYAEEEIIGHFGNVLYQKGEYIETIVTKNGVAETKKLPNGNYYLVERNPKEGYCNIDPVHVTIDDDTLKTISLEIQNYLSTGTVKLFKKDSSGKPLSGVVFGLYSKNGRKLDEQTTNEEGIIIWQRLPIGEYQIKELSTIEGFILDTRKEKITVNEKETLNIEKINVPLLPNTSGKRHSCFGLIIGLFGLYFGKKWVS